jgi:DNA-binding transcriptional regulator YhcF (GntR family)
MDDKRKPVNGTFTQVPNVFFDTCDLPETAQILYLRLFRKIGYNGGKFTGSIRDLAEFVRLSKSTADRMSRKLKEAGLINLEREEGQDAMTITVNTESLWALNRQHYDNPVPNWDTKLPELSQFGTTASQNGTILSQIGTRASQIGTTSSSNQGGNTNKTTNTGNSISSSQNKSSSGMTNMREILERQKRERGEQ